MCRQAKNVSGQDIQGGGGDDVLKGCIGGDGGEVFFLKARRHARNALEDLAGVGDCEGEGEEVGDDLVDIVSADARGQSDTRGRSGRRHVVNVWWKDVNAGLQLE